MKQLLTIVLLTFSASAFAHHQHGHGHGHGHWRSTPSGGWNWVIPAIVGGAIVYEVTRPPVVVQQPPVVIQQQAQQCSPWAETQNSDGTVTRTRTCTQ